MAPKQRIAHIAKFPEIVCKKPKDPVVDIKKRKYFDDEAKEVKVKKQKKTHRKDKKSDNEETQKLCTDSEKSFIVRQGYYNRPIESRVRCLPEYVEKKIASLIEFVNRLPKRPARKTKIFPIKGIYKQCQ